MVGELLHVYVKPMSHGYAKDGKRTVPGRPIVRAQTYPAHHRSFDCPPHGHPVLIELNRHRERRKQEGETEKREYQQTVVTIAVVGEVAQAHVDEQHGFVVDSSRKKYRRQKSTYQSEHCNGQCVVSGG